jgi:hypothetical protein
MLHYFPNGINNLLFTKNFFFIQFESLRSYLLDLNKALT